MAKAKLGFVLAGAYALGLAVLVVAGLSLPCGTLLRVRTALGRVPASAQRAATLARVAVHAGTLGVKYLPAALGPQGVLLPHRTQRFCNREPEAGCGSSAVPVPTGSLGPNGPVVVRVVVRDDG